MGPFYETVAGFCFMLLGLWWAVIQFRYDEWGHDGLHRRMVASVHGSFLIPGVMSLGALLGGDSPLLWQAIFVIAGVVGAVATVSVLVALGSYQGISWVGRVALGGCAVLYGLIAGFALDPGLLAGLGVMLAPLQFEGLCVTLVIVLGVQVAWEAMMGGSYGGAASRQRR